MNSVNRNGPGTPVRLDRDDFEVYRTELVTQSSTVVMLDMSWSMLLNDLWHPAKKVAIALESLIRGQFPRDDLYLVGFSYMAREFKPEELIEIGEWDHVQGTNMVHGLMRGAPALGRSRGVNKQIIMITDGGPSVYQMGGLGLRLAAASRGDAADAPRGESLYPRKHHHQRVHAVG